MTQATKISATGNAAIDNFIIDITIVSPITKIVSDLKAGIFRDCDIKWLDAKLAAFTQLSCETLGLHFQAPVNSEYTKMNDFVKKQFINRFNTLLAYFVKYKG